MNNILLIDFGSTYTKLTAVDTDSERVLGTSQSYTTVETDIINGYEKALHELRTQIGDIQFAKRIACSSAAGGLKMVAVGLVPELTSKAARLASLGAGAKVIKTYSYELTKADLNEIDSTKPDICLLCGGTDGGNKEVIIHNATMLANSKGNFPIVYAGNRNAEEECSQILSAKQCIVCSNVMPRLGVSDSAPVQRAIREIFLSQIVKAKGLSKAQDLVGGILMPTPSAVLSAMELLSRGTEREKGIGELLAVDLGGATTDVYSMCYGLPTNPLTTLRGLREEYAKRTVEGDIGMRYSIKGILDAGSLYEISQISGLAEDVCLRKIEHLAQNTEELPKTDEDRNLDLALACIAVRTAVARHAGRIEEYYTPMGISYIQTGKDLSNVETIIETGGALVRTGFAQQIGRFALRSEKDPMSLRPKKANVLTDRKYILAAMGLLSTEYPEIALRIMKKELI